MPRNVNFGYNGCSSKIKNIIRDNTSDSKKKKKEEKEKNNNK
jgi:hypothetical protein